MNFFDKQIIKVFYIFIASRIVVFFFGLMSSYIFKKDFNFCQWDCGWYSALIKNGYDISPHGHAEGDAANWAFFPVFPKTISLLNDYLQINHLNIAYFINNFVFFVALYVMYIYIKKEFNEYIAMNSILLMAFSPYSLYFSVPYTESFFFLFMILVFYFIIQDKWIYAGIAAALLSGTKAIGVMIVFPMLILAIKQVGLSNLLMFKTDRSYQILLAIVMAPLGLFIFMQYLYYNTGDSLAFSHIQLAWDRYPTNPLIVLSDGLMKVGTLDFYFALISLCALFLSLILLFIKRYAEFIFTIIVILIPLSTALYAMPRYSFSLFTIYIAIAILINKSELLKTILLLFFSAGLAFMSSVWILSKWFTV